MIRKTPTGFRQTSLKRPRSGSVAVVKLANLELHEESVSGAGRLGIEQVPLHMSSKAGRPIILVPLAQFGAEIYFEESFHLSDCWCVHFWSFLIVGIKRNPKLKDPNWNPSPPEILSLKAYKFMAPNHAIDLSVIHHEELNTLESVVDAALYKVLVVTWDVKWSRSDFHVFPNA